MSRNYHILDQKHREELSDYLSREGQLLLPLVELLETALGRSRVTHIDKKKRVA